MRQTLKRRHVPLFWSRNHQTSSRSHQSIRLISWEGAFCSASFYSLSECKGFGEVWGLVQVIRRVGPTFWRKTFFLQSGHKFKGTFLFPSTWGEISADDRSWWRRSPDLHLSVICPWSQTSKGLLWILRPHRRSLDSKIHFCQMVQTHFFKRLQRKMNNCRAHVPWRGSSAAPEDTVTWGPRVERNRNGCSTVQTIKRTPMNGCSRFKFISVKCWNKIH